MPSYSRQDAFAAAADFSEPAAPPLRFLRARYADAALMLVRDAIVTLFRQRRYT